MDSKPTSKNCPVSPQISSMTNFAYSGFPIYIYTPPPYEVVGSFMMRTRHHRVNLISRETGPEG